MADFALKRGETRTVTFALFAAGGGAFDVDGYTVTMAIDGSGVHDTKAATLNTPSTLGTGSFSFTATDYTALKPTLQGTRRVREPYAFEVWAHDGDENIPMLTGTFDVVDVPQRV
jgi:hypothetical protein